uniref:Mitochondrial dicarboxylate carrier-like n=1 Tax=Ciona intestinalis TaxID=7719 RepID=H2XS14_CIOIN|nr:mitochondrial dicarboxylate carrier-like [Ciona intestinalis]|eukprot:XP_002126004.1 mitochondrial dicarboxylate carrier-like [Ciona intestinalis]
MQLDNTKRISKWYHGGLASAAAACCTHPLDLLKVHLQTHQGTRIGGTQMAVNIIRSQGLTALYNGLSASVGRQLTYSMTRFAFYDVMKPLMIKKGKDPTMAQKMLLASIGGFMGGVVGTPCDMINVRMQNDIKLPVELRRNYKHVFDGLYQVATKEGVSTLFNGVTMASTRAVLITNGQLAFYDQIKENLLQTSFFQDNIITHLTASMMAGTIATAMTQPVDVMKTRLMNAKKGEYRGIWDCVVQTGKQGPLSFFKGFVPAFIRLGPQTILIWVFKEQLRLRFGKHPV